MSADNATSFIVSFLRRVPSILGSLFFALLIWFFVAMTKRYAAAFSLPVVVKSENATRTVKSGFPTRVEVKLEAEGWKLLSLYLARSEWTIDLSNELPKERLEIETLPKAAQYIKPFPEGMKVLEVDPPILEFELDEKITKRVPIRLAATLEARPGYAVRPALVLQPDSLTISGPRSVLDSIAFWNTAPQIARDLANAFELELPIDDALAGVVSKSVGKVKARGVAEQLSEVEFADVPVSLLKSKRPVYVTLIPNRVRVWLGGAVSELAKVRAESLSVIIDGEKLLADTTGFVAPVVKRPPGLEVRRIEPERLQYILRN